MPLWCLYWLQYAALCGQQGRRTLHPLRQNLHPNHRLPYKGMIDRIRFTFVMLPLRSISLESTSWRSYSKKEFSRIYYPRLKTKYLSSSFLLYPVKNRGFLVSRLSPKFLVVSIEEHVLTNRACELTDQSWKPPYQHYRLIMRCEQTYLLSDKFRSNSNFSSWMRAISAEPKAERDKHQTLQCYGHCTKIELQGTHSPPLKILPWWGWILRVNFEGRI